MDNPTISKLIELPKLRVYDADLLIFEKEYPFESTYKLVDRNTYLGIEVEIENVRHFRRTSPYWHMIEDGSLRNYGKEFVSLPIKAWRAEQALNTLFADLNSDIEFTERTSVHIHMNIRTLTIPQLETLILTYIVFERALFNFIGEDRYNNIFCVPIIETQFGSNLSNLITRKQLAFNWQKYTAMNALPIWDKGTLEFRHLGGTKDIKKILTWINILLSLKIFALQKSPEYIWDTILSLNTNSQYRMFGEEVFKEQLPTLWNDSFNENVAECVSYIKTFCIENEFQKELNQPTNYISQYMITDDLVEDTRQPDAFNRILQEITRNPQFPTGNPTPHLAEFLNLEQQQRMNATRPQISNIARNF